LELLYEEYETLTAAAHELEDRIAANVTTLLEAE
jgi:hypothetical protein